MVLSFITIMHKTKILAYNIFLGKKKEIAKNMLTIYTIHSNIIKHSEFGATI